jgi:hypothetical protein
VKLRVDPGEKVLKVGTFLYTDSVVCDMRLTYSPVRYGTGDADDPPHIANDRSLPSYLRDVVWNDETPGDE